MLLQFIWINLTKTTFNVNFTNDKTSQHRVSHNRKHERISITSPVISSTKSNHRETSDNLKLRDILQSYWLGLKKKKIIPERDWKDMTTKCNPWPWTRSWMYKEHCLDKWQHLDGVQALTDRIKSMLIFWFWWCSVVLQERNLFLGNRYKSFKG